MVPNDMEIVPEVRKRKSKLMSEMYDIDKGAFSLDGPLRLVETVTGSLYKGPGSSISGS